MKINRLFLLAIVVLAFSLRFFHLGELPLVLNRDEAALAYNAFLLRETGRDEWQISWPMTFKSFGDYKLPGYPYLLASLFSIFPLNDFLVRLPSALAGVSLVFLAYFFARDILQVKANNALIMSLLVALSPVFFFYSRIAFEANLALLLFVLGLYFLMRRSNKPILGAFCLFLAVLTYNTPLLLLPLILPILIYHFGFKKIKNWLWPGILLTGIFIFGLVNFFALASQKSAITIFNDPSTWEAYALYREGFSGFWQAFFGNQYFFYAKLIWRNFIESFSLNFLVQNGGSHPWHNLPSFGHLFYSVYFLAIFMIVDLFGEIVVFFLDKTSKLIKTHLVWLFLTLVALAPSVVTVDSPHATRSLFFFFMLLALATLFFDKLTRIFPKQSKLFTLFFLTLLLVESTVYYKEYFLTYKNQQPESLFSNYPKFLQEAAVKYSNQEVAVLDGGGYQYILTAWYLRVPAAQFFATIKYQGADNINFYYGEKLLNYHFIKDLEDRSEEEKVVISPKSGLATYD